jgi:chemotaxis methyl-accepting protein methylase
MLLPFQFRHVVFPREARRRAVVNVAAANEPAPAAAKAGPGLAGEAAAFVHGLFSRAGLDARHYRSEMLQRRLPACLRALRARSLAHARQVLEAAPELVSAAVSAMLIGVSGFFRDPPVFQLLRDVVLPELSRGGHGLHVWSAGCSEGAEVYSAAILLAELNLQNHSYLLGTDCRPDAVQRARAGAFDALAVKHVSEERLARFFVPQAAGWQVIPPLRHAVRWRSADILKTQEPGLWDLIFFRNTAIYLRPEVTGPLWERFAQSLRPGGVLVLGKAERPVGSRRWSLAGPCIYRRSRG